MTVYEHYTPPEETNVPGIIYLPKYPVMDLTPFPPCKLFDDLYFIGTTFVGTLIVKTSDGLVLIDSMNSRQDVENIIFPCMREMGLDPMQIKAVIITHGHFDHFGGANAIVEATGCRVFMSRVDSEFMRVCDLVPTGFTLEFPEVTDYLDEGDSYTCGETTFVASFTPGHTPGGLSLIFPVHDGEKEHKVSLWGGINPPKDAEGCAVYAASAQHFQELSLAHGCDVEFSVHPFVDYSIDKMQLLPLRKEGQAHPLVIGSDGVALFMQIVRHTAVQMLNKM